MRTLFFILLLLFCVCFLPCSSQPTKRTGNLSRLQVQKRFVLHLSDTGSIEVTQKNVKKLRHNAKNADCIVVRVYKQLRMLKVNCDSVNNPKMVLLLNAKLEKLPGVKSSSPDAVISSLPSQTKLGRDEGPDVPMFRPDVRMMGNGLPYNWGLDRIDEDASPLDGEELDYSCYPKLGKGVKVFVIDTGCMVEHNEFEGGNVRTIPAPESDFIDGVDDHGHGTHIAGVIIGKNVGLARNADVTCIKAFDRYGNGAATDTISAVEYIIEEKFRNSSVPFIVNLSYSALTGLSQTPLDEMVYAASVNGIVFVVSAGNAAVSSCLFSPSKAELALTVTASTKADRLEEDSNIGPCVEFIAPGHEIVSAGIDSKRDYESLNGTSMATPHIVALSALVLAEHPNMQTNPPGVRDVLYEKLLSGRTAFVDGFIMPLMETECNALAQGQAPRMRNGSNNWDSSPVASPVPVSPVPSLSPSPSPSSFPSPSWTPTPSPSVTPRPKYAPDDPEYWYHRHAWEMESDLGNESVPDADNYYQHGFGPFDNPYEKSGNGDAK